MVKYEFVCWIRECNRPELIQTLAHQSRVTGAIGIEPRQFLGATVGIPEDGKLHRNLPFSIGIGERLHPRHQGIQRHLIV